MGMFSRCRMRRVAFAGAIAVVSLTLAVGPAVADTELGHKGRVGRHQLRDKPTMNGTHTYFTSPGATCFYDDGTHALVEIVTRPPKIWARDVNAMRNSQKVGFQVIVKQVDFPDSVSTFSKSTIQKTTAYDDAFAA